MLEINQSYGNHVLAASKYYCSLATKNPQAFRALLCSDVHLEHQNQSERDVQEGIAKVMTSFLARFFNNTKYIQAINCEFSFSPDGSVGITSSTREYKLDLKKWVNVQDQTTLSFESSDKGLKIKTIAMRTIITPEVPDEGWSLNPLKYFNLV
jgi:hypothetical protein